MTGRQKPRKIQNSIKGSSSRLGVGRRRHYTAVKARAVPQSSETFIAIFRTAIKVFFYAFIAVEWEEIDMLQSIMALAAGFALLVWGADRFVAAASAAARRLGVPALVIGLTVVAFGTSAPELAVSVTAALKGANDIAVGNVLGSNIFNLLGVAGISALFCPLAASGDLIKRDWPLSAAAASMLLGLMATGGRISRGEGVLLLALFGALLLSQLKPVLHRRAAEEKDIAGMKTWQICLGIAFGLAAIVWGGDLAVDGASGLARVFGLSEAFIGLTIVAIGTSLPELVTSVMAARRGENDIALGNIIGSNLFNILFILGASAAIHPIAIATHSLLDAAFLIAMTAVFWLAARRATLSRGTGFVMMLAYIGYTAWLFVR